LVESWLINHRFHGVALPALTRLILLPPSWLLFCPIPWLLGAGWLLRRKHLTPGTVFVFAGTVCLGMSIVVAAVVLAALLPEGLMHS